MLVLKRQTNESITLQTSDGDITIIISPEGKHKHASVNLVIDAPKTVKVLRTELLNKDD